jgi:hypothetical protein
MQNQGYRKWKVGSKLSIGIQARVKVKVAAFADALMTPRQLVISEMVTLRCNCNAAFLPDSLLELHMHTPLLGKASQSTREYLLHFCQCMQA